MDEEKLARTLKQEGFRQTYVWEHAPNVSYANHTHATETAHLILSGEMTLTMAAEGRTYRAPVNAVMCPLAPCTPCAWD